MKAYPGTWGLQGHCYLSIQDSRRSDAAQYAASPCYPFRGDHACMQLTDRQIEEFRQICQNVLGLELMKAEAETEANDLMRLYELLIRPLATGGVRGGDHRDKVD